MVSLKDLHAAIGERVPSEQRRTDRREMSNANRTYRSVRSLYSERTYSMAVKGLSVFPFLIQSCVLCQNPIPPTFVIHCVPCKSPHPPVICALRIDLTENAADRVYPGDRAERHALPFPYGLVEPRATGLVVRSLKISGPHAGRPEILRMKMWRVRIVRAPAAVGRENGSAAPLGHGAAVRVAHRFLAVDRIRAAVNPARGFRVP